MSLSSCSDAEGVMEGREGEGAMEMVDGRAVVLNTEVDSWVITSLLSTSRPL